MNEYALLAFVITPLFVIALGYVATRLHEWDLNRRKAHREPT